MKDLVEDMYCITASKIGKILPKKLAIGFINLDIENSQTQIIKVVSTPSNLQGYIRWFICPSCQRRAGKMYLPCGEAIFLCRHCYDLGYKKQFTRTFKKASKGGYISKALKKRTHQLNTVELLKKLRKFLGKDVPKGNIP